MRLFVLGLLLMGSALAQETGPSVTEPGVPTEVAPGITITVDTTSAIGEIKLADEIHIYPYRVEKAIPFDRDYEMFSLELSSRVPTEVVIEVFPPDLLVPRQSELVRVPAGARVTTSFTAYEAHSGEIRISNTDGVLLAVVPYDIYKDSRFRQRVGASVSGGFSTDFTTYEYDSPQLGVGYQIRERETGVSGGISLNFDGDLSISGSIGGSYEW